MEEKSVVTFGSVVTSPYMYKVLFLLKALIGGGGSVGSGESV